MSAVSAIMAGAGQIVGGVTNVIGNAQQKKLNEQNQRMAIVSGLQARALAQDQARIEQRKAQAQQKADEKKQKNTLLIAGIIGGFILIAVIIFIATKKQN
jgi:uncharacterized membrane protein HdeD (DUF308 family)